MNPAGYDLEIGLTLVTQMQEQTLIVGHRGVGGLSVDAGALRGEGGPQNPRLVVPVTIRLEPRPTGAGIAVTQLQGSLSSSQDHNPANLIGRPVHEHLVNSFPVRSYPKSSESHTVLLNFFIEAQEITALERLRHSATSGLFELYLHLTPVVAGLQTSDELRVADSESYPLDLGAYSQVLPFWRATVLPIRISIETSAWTRDVLPGLGYDRVRHIEVTFPPSLPEHEAATASFDFARQALDEKRYSECVASCRGILNLWVNQYSATNTVKIAQRVAKARGWGDDDKRVDFLDRIWKATTDMVNTPHHPEGSTEPLTVDASDARLLFMLVAALSEYLG